MTSPNFSRGADAARERNARKTGNFASMRYFSLKNQEQQVIRLLDDGDAWITVKQHTSVPTKNPPADAKNWPEALPAVCRYDEAFEGIHRDCYICDKPIINPRNQKPVTAPSRTYALAVVRKEIGNGKYEDDTVEVTRTRDGVETTTTELNIVIVNMGWKNFFSALDGYHGMTGTIKNQDFVIKRQGEGLDTDYVILAVPNPEVLTSEEWDARYGKALIEQNLDLGTIVSDKASDDFYRRYFDDRHTAGSTGDTQPEAGAPAVEQDAAPSGEVPASALEAMRARVRGLSSTSS